MRRRRPTTTLFALLSLVTAHVASACAHEPLSSGRARTDAGGAPIDPPRDAGATPPGRDAGRAATDAPDAGDPFASLDRTRDPSCRAAWIAGIAGRVVDEHGAPIPDARAQPCMQLAGTDRRLCLAPGTSDAHGRFAIEVLAEARCVDEVAMRVILPNEPRSTSYCPIALAPDDGVLTLDAPFTLFATAAPSARGARTTFDGAELDVRADDLDPGALDALTARVLDGDALARTCPGADHAGFELALTFAPETPVYESGAPFRITRALSGDRFEVLVLGGLGTLVAGELVPEGTWARIGTARRDAASGAIVPDASTRLPHLSTIALRRM